VSGSTFGQIVAGARKDARMSQKELASRILKEDGTPISPQYLNDLERDRRNPPAEPLLRQFAAQLGLDPEYLCFVAGQFPSDLRRMDGEAYSQERVAAAFRAFRRSLREAVGAPAEVEGAQRPTSSGVKGES
jgi:transcriptional regulator with XRE-family HTH domain